MNVLINHCWCSDSNWGGHYNCRVIVDFERYAETKDVWTNKETNDWKNLLDPVHYNPDDVMCRRETFRLKPEVTEWLTANVKDRDCDEHKQGWAVGTDKYNSKNPIQFCLFFERQTDAMKFIKRFSIHQKPVDYLNYFKDIRRKLDFKTNRLKRVAR